MTPRLSLAPVEGRPVRALVQSGETCVDVSECLTRFAPLAFSLPLPSECLAHSLIGETQSFD